LNKRDLPLAAIRKGAAAKIGKIGVITAKKGVKTAKWGWKQQKWE